MHIKVVPTGVGVRGVPPTSQKFANLLAPGKITPSRLPLTNPPTKGSFPH